MDSTFLHAIPCTSHYASPDRPLPLLQEPTQYLKQEKHKNTDIQQNSQTLSIKWHCNNRDG